MRRNICLLIIAFFITTTVSFATSFTDIEGHWAKASIEKYESYEIINGYNGAFRPDNFITRGEMAVILDKIMKYKAISNNEFIDLDKEFYNEPILRAYSAGVINGYNDKSVKPRNYLTREEAIVMIAKAFGIEPNKEQKSIFVDNNEIADWAIGYVSEFANKGYVSGNNRNFRPKNGITRAETITIFNNIIGGVYKEANTYSEDAIGTVIINTSDVILKEMKIAGNLIITEGVGEGNVTLSNVEVTSNLIVKGGGENSIYISNGTKIGSIIINKTEQGAIRVVSEAGCDINTVVIDDGKDDVIIDGKFNNVSIEGNSPVVIKNAEIDSIIVNTVKSDITLESGKINTFSVADAATNSSIDIKKNMSVTMLSVNAAENALNIAGKVDIVDVATSDSTVNIENSASVEKINATEGTNITKRAEPKSSTSSGRSSRSNSVYYTLSFIDGMGTTNGRLDEIKVKSGDSGKLPLNTFTKLGYVFAGWSDGSNIYQENEIYTPIEDKEFIAVWNIDEENDNFKIIDGVIFNKEGTILIEYPEDKADTKYRIPYGVVEIGNGAFRNAEELNSIEIPETVEKISDNEFNPDIVIYGLGEFAEDYANDNDYSFKKIVFISTITLNRSELRVNLLEDAILNLPNGVKMVSIEKDEKGTYTVVLETKIGYAFRNSGSIKTLTEVEKSDVMEYGKFSYELSKGNKITIIGYNYQDETEIIIPSKINGYDVIRVTARFKYAELEKITIPASVTVMGNKLFNDNTILCGEVDSYVFDYAKDEKYKFANINTGKEVIFVENNKVGGVFLKIDLDNHLAETPDNVAVESIVEDDSTFSVTLFANNGYEFEGEKSEIVLNGIEKTNDFSEGKYRFGLKEDNEVIVIEYIGNEIQAIIPDKIREYPVTEIAENAFNANIKKVTVPESIVSIEEEAFQDGTIIRSTLSSYAYKYVVEYVYDLDFENVVTSNKVIIVIDKEVNGVKFLVKCTLDGLTRVPDGVDETAIDIQEGLMGTYNVTLHAKSGYEFTDGLNTITVNGIKKEKNIFTEGNYEYEVTDEGEVTIIECSCDDGTILEIPSTVLAYRVVGIDCKIEYKTLEKVIIPTSVVEIEDDAFSESIIICGEIGSEAQEYANYNGNIFEDVETGNRIIFVDLSRNTVNGKVIKISFNDEVIEVIPDGTEVESVEKVSDKYTVTLTSKVGYTFSNGETEVILNEINKSNIFAEGSFKYSLLNNGTVSIIGYEFNGETDIEIPKEILDYEVTMIDTNDFWDIEEITIWSNIIDIIEDDIFNANVVIYGEENSCAEEYADANGYYFEIINNEVTNILTTPRDRMILIEESAEERVETIDDKEIEKIIKPIDEERAEETEDETIIELQKKLIVEDNEIKIEVVIDEQE